MTLTQTKKIKVPQIIFKDRKIHWKKSLKDFIGQVGAIKGMWLITK